MIRNLFKNTYCEFLDFLAEGSFFHKISHIFYISGPFFLLIERSPADFWLSVCVIIFLTNSLIKKSWSWCRKIWVVSAFIFWGVALFSAANSSMPLYSLGEAGAWFRFPLFAMASCYFFCVDKRVLYAMALSTFIGMILMTLILIAELLIVGQTSGRLSWPYGDLTPGSYLAKACLPIFCALVAYAVSQHKTKNVIAGLVSLITIVVSLLAGERINFLIRACAGILSGLVWKPKKLVVFLLVLFEVIALSFVFNADETTAKRYTDSFFKQLPIHEESPYWRVWKGGIVAFQQSPILGIGPDIYRKTCPELIGSRKDIDCHTHPHNFYIQLAGETGLIGVLSGTLMILAIIFTCFTHRLKSRDNIFTATAFIVPLAVFFPLQSTADFFGQWNNLFLWFGVAFALSSGAALSKNRNIG